MPRSHLAAVLQALLVTFLWSTSWVLIKIGLDDIPALTFAGLRYATAWGVLAAVALARRRRRAAPPRLDRRTWSRLALLGVVVYAVTQGAQFLSLAYLSATSASLVLSFTPVAVALLSAALLSEPTRPGQWMGVALTLAGVLMYFLPASLPPSERLGLAAALLGLAANAAGSLLGRGINRSGLDPLTVTLVSMGVGAPLLLGGGVALQGLPPLSASSWAIVAWLALVNTAFAFTLWNHTLRTLSAVESSVINNTMLVQIALLAWLFLGERPGPKELLGLGLAALGTAVVQLAGRRRASRDPRGRPPRDEPEGGAPSRDDG